MSTLLRCVILALLGPLAVLAAPPVVLIQGDIACGAHTSGSGVVVAPGVVATNAHVVQGSVEVRIEVDGRIYRPSGHILAPDLDLCLLRVPALPLEPVALRSEALLPEAPLTSVSFPGGRGPVTTGGRLKALWCYKDGQLIQSDAPIAPGSSGGGLFDGAGRLAGITSFVFIQEVGFHVAVPVVWVEELLMRPWQEGDQIQSCRPRELLLHDFLERMTEAPSNRDAWEGFTRAWVAKRPRDPEAWFSLGHALHTRHRSIVEARGEADPEVLKAMEEAYRKAIDLNPSYVRAWNNLGVVMDLSNRFKEAEAAFRMALQVQPDYGLAWLNLGSTLINQRCFPDAVEALRRGLRFKPDEDRGWSRLGYSALQAGQPLEAVRAVRVALRYRPFDLDLWKLLVQALRKGGDPAGEALAWADLGRLGEDRVMEVRRRLAP